MLESSNYRRTRSVRESSSILKKQTAIEHTFVSIEMVVHTLIQYKDSDGRDRTKKTKQFGPQTRLDDIKRWILSWLKILCTFVLEIKDPDDDFVDFDEQYIDEYKPFDTSESMQASTSTSSPIVLRIVMMRDNSQNVATNTSHETSTTTYSSTMHQHHRGVPISIAEQPNMSIQRIASQNYFSSFCASEPIVIDEKKPEMKFTKNVNDIQRDQYKSDKSKAVTTKKPGYFVRIQGDKRGLEKRDTYKTVYPRLKVLNFIPENERPTWILRIFLLYEICLNGKRKLYHNEERQFITNDVDQPTSPLNMSTLSEIQDRDNLRGGPLIVPITERLCSEDGEELDLKTFVILQTKTHSKEMKSLFCELKNEYLNDITYETTRLGCLLEQNGKILWNQLLLSDAMTFPKSMDKIADREVKDNNGTLLETIPVRLLKRKTDLNQSDAVKKRPPRGKNAQQYIGQTDTPDPMVNQHHQVQMTVHPLHSQAEHPIYTTEEQFQYSNFQNEHLPYQHMASSYSMTDLSNSQHMLRPIATTNRSDAFFQQQSSTIDMISYVDQTQRNVGTEMLSPISSFHSNVMEESNYYNFLPHEQQEGLSQSNSSLPSINSFFQQSTSNTSLEDSLIPGFMDDGEGFTDASQ